MWALARGIEAAIAVKRTFRMSQVERVCGWIKNVQSSKGTPQRDRTKADKGEGKKKEEEEGED